MTDQQRDWLEHEPAGTQYHDLVNALQATCTSFALVVRDFELSPNGHEALAALRSAELERVETSEWPGTRLLGNTATVIRFRLEPATATILRETARRLYAWRAPRLPEDPSFYRPDGSCMLAVIAHERLAFFESLTAEERKTITSLGITFESQPDSIDHRDAMRLEDGERRVSVFVTGYQFPAHTDIDWLFVRLECADDRGAWSGVNPSMLSEELPDLADWFEAAGSDQPQPTFKFLEPNIRFEVLDQTNEGVVVRVLFELESRPPWSPSRIVEGAPYIVDLTVTRGGLEAAAGAIRRQHGAYPLRSQP